MRSLKFFGLVAGLSAVLAFIAFTRPPQYASADALSGPVARILTDTATVPPTNTATVPPPPTDTPTPVFTPTNTGVPPTPTRTRRAPPGPPRQRTPPAFRTTNPGDTPPPPGGDDPVITKEESVDLAKIGDDVVYTIRVFNPTEYYFDEISVTDSFPSQLDFLGASTDQGSFTYDAGSNSITVNIGGLGPGQTVVITVRMRVNATAQPADVLRNTALLLIDGVPWRSSNTVILRLTPGAIPATGLVPELGNGLSMLIALIVGSLPVVIWAVSRRRTMPH